MHSDIGQHGHINNAMTPGDSTKTDIFASTRFASKWRYIGNAKESRSAYGQFL
jgi:hypothetical protein